MATFFHVLPAEVHEKIVNHIFFSLECDETYANKPSMVDNQNSDSLLQYGFQSPAHGHAVTRAMRFRLFITQGWRTDSVTQWIKMCSGNLLELDIFGAPTFSFGLTAPMLPSLRKAFIGTRSEHVSLIHGSPKLTDLKVIIEDTCAWEGLISCLKSLPLKSFYMSYSDSVPEALRNFEDVDLPSLHVACRNVEDFFFQSLKVKDVFWDVVKGLPNLKRLTLTGKVEEQQVPFLQSLQELEVKMCRRLEDTKPFHKNLVGVQPFLSDEEEILELGSFKKLRELSANIARGQEQFLIGVIDNIEHLDLSWNFSSCSHIVQGIHGPCDHPHYHEPDPDVLQGIVKSAKRLRTLKLQYAILTSNAIEEVLMVAGATLESLAINQDWQSEAVPSRLENIFKAIVKFCPRLKTLLFSELDDDEPLPIFATTEQKKRCMRALENVCRALPGLETVRNIRFIIEHRFTDVRSGALMWDHILQGDPCRST